MKCSARLLRGTHQPHPEEADLSSGGAGQGGAGTASIQSPRGMGLGWTCSSRVLGMACEFRGELRFLLSLPHPRAITEQKQKMKRLGSDLTSAQKEMKTKHKAYENAVGILSRRLQEALAAKEAAEAELSQLRAQAAWACSSVSVRLP